MNKKRILIVDDDVVAAALLKTMLEQTGSYEVRTESQSSRGLAVTQEYRPALVLLDVEMPNITGGEVAFRIRADKTVGQTPILFLTSMVSQLEAGSAPLIRGGHEFMAKPAPLPKLVERIEAIIAQQSLLKAG